MKPGIASRSRRKRSFANASERRKSFERQASARCQRARERATTFPRGGGGERSLSRLERREHEAAAPRVLGDARRRPARGVARRAVRVKEERVDVRVDLRRDDEARVERFLQPDRRDVVLDAAVEVPARERRRGNDRSSDVHPENAYPENARAREREREGCALCERTPRRPSAGARRRAAACRRGRRGRAPRGARAARSA